MDTTTNAAAQPAFYTVNTGPTSVRYPGLSQFAVNAMVIANQSSWEEEFRRLLEQVHRIHLMPNEQRCAYALLEAGGFIRQPGIKEFVTVGDVVSRMNAQCTDGQIAIVRCNYPGVIIAIVPDSCDKYIPAPADGQRYHAYGLKGRCGYVVSDVWVRWADGQDHSPVKRRKGHGCARKKEHQALEDHEAFHYLQKNPTHFTGDCVIRAMASACGDISWEEAMDRIAAASNYANTTVNQRDIYLQLLQQEGFVKRAPMKVGGRKLTGKAFCRELDRMMHRGERIFAEVGRSHVAAVLPFTEDGVTRYKIVDCWDSTDRLIDDYWVKEPVQQAPPTPPAGSLAAGDSIVHPTYGSGRIENIHPAGWMTVRWADGSTRMLSSKWVVSNCGVEAA